MEMQGVNLAGAATSQVQMCKAVVIPAAMLKAATLRQVSAFPESLPSTRGRTKHDTHQQIDSHGIRTLVCEQFLALLSLGQSSLLVSIVPRGRQGYVFQ